MVLFLLIIMLFSIPTAAMEDGKMERVHLQPILESHDEHQETDEDFLGYLSHTKRIRVLREYLQNLKPGKELNVPLQGGPIGLLLVALNLDGFDLKDLLITHNNHEIDIDHPRLTPIGSIVHHENNQVSQCFLENGKPHGYIEAFSPFCFPTLESLEHLIPKTLYQIQGIIGPLDSQSKEYAYYAKITRKSFDP